jgi:very-short-patch-repair endonuclease
LRKKKWDLVELQKYYDDGYSISETSQYFGISISYLGKLKRNGELIFRDREEAHRKYVCDHKKNGATKKHYDWDAIQKYYDCGHTLRECIKYFDVKSSTTMHKACNRGDLKTRDASEASRLSFEKYGRPKMSDDVKMAISRAMKIAHSEGRAHNIGMSRWNNEPSYPETFFMKIIENEFNDKNYIREYSVVRYAVDFAWVDRKLAVEIDGDQHQRFQEYKDRDAKKDELLQSQGWEILRIVWKDMFHNPQYWISIAKKFIDRY